MLTPLSILRKILILTVFISSQVVAQNPDQEAFGFTLSGNYRLQNYDVVNTYAKVFSDVFKTTAPLKFSNTTSDTYGVGISRKGKTSEFELGMDYAKTNIAQSNAAGTKAELTKTGYTLGAMFNFYIRRYFFIGTTLMGSSYSINSAITPMGVVDKFNYDLGFENHKKQSPNINADLRLQAGVYIPFAKWVGLRIMPYYDLKTKYDFTKNLYGDVLQKYGGDKTQTSLAYGVKASLVIIPKPYKAKVYTQDQYDAWEKEREMREIEKKNNPHIDDDNRPWYPCPDCNKGSIYYIEKDYHGKTIKVSCPRCNGTGYRH